MKKTVLILAVLLCSMAFSASVLAENDGIAATSSGTTVKMAGGTPGGADWGYPAPFTFYPRGPGYSRMSLLFDTLTWKDADGVIPALADGWKVSDNGKEWTFYLDRNAKWHDGELFTADDVKFTIEYMQNHEGEFTWFESINYIDDVEVIDDYTVVIDLNAPMASFLVDIAGNVPILPEHIWDDVSDPLTFKTDDAVIGTGPLKLVEYDSAMSSYQYEANDDYYDGKLLVDEFISMEVSDAPAALQTGDVDEVSFWGSEITAVQGFEGDPDFEIITGPSFWVLQVIFNCEKYPNDILEFRQAIAHGIDRGTIVSNVLNDGGIPANTGIMHPDSIWYNPDCTVYEHSADAANDTLDLLGFEDTDGNGIRNYPAGAERSGEITFDLYTTGKFSRVAELIEANLAVIGIGIEVRSSPWGPIDTRLKEGNFDVVISGHGGIANPQIMRIPSWPASTYQNSEYDSTFADQEVEMDLDRRKELVNDLQEIVADDLPVYTLYHPYMWCVYNPTVLDTWFYTRDGIGIGIPLELNKLIFLARYGDANENGEINMQDVTKIERMIMELDDESDMADANQNDKINMQDVTHIELIMLGRAPIRTG
ncbi:MAG: ABC transporter substrate-binding protein [Euryarchaeota archaeon]|nr:ABC transporter substrate-binding protein [Euryarchaeota archaeon]